MKRVIPAVVAVMIMGMAGGYAGEREWVDSVMSTLTLRERVAQITVPHIVVRDTPQGRAAVLRAVKDHRVGGILLGEGKVSDYVGLNDLAQRNSRIPLMITADAEWGPAMRLSDAPRFPMNIALGATADTALIADYGREVGLQCLLLGMGVNFAPVADVNSNPANPVIGNRSFGTSAERVGALSSAFARGMQEAGVMAVAKHFPGHGDTSTDSHLELPVINRSMEELERVELEPFRTLISDGVQGIMMAHLFVPAIEPERVPTSLSNKAVTGLLKERMGFEGLIFTDALEMQGARTGKGENNCVQALRAGVDVLLGPTDYVKDIDAVVRAVEEGRLPAETVDRAVRRVLTAKYRMGYDHPQRVSTTAAELNTEQTRELMERLSRACVTVVGNPEGLLPILDRKRKIEIRPIGSASSGEFGQTVDEKGYVVSSGGEIILAPVFSANASARKALSELVRREGRKVVPIFFVNTLRLSNFAEALEGVDVFVAMGDDTPSLRRAAAEAVMGMATATGRLAAPVRGIAGEGEGVDLIGIRPVIEQIDHVVQQGLNTGAFPGCQVLITRNGDTIYERTGGRVLNTARSAAVTEQTLFDLASLSKVAGTTAALMGAYDDGLYELDDPLSKFVEESAGTPIGELTIRELMHHTTGLPSVLSIYSIVLDPESYMPPLFRKKRGGVWTIPYADAGYANSNARLRTDLLSYSERDGMVEIADGLWGSEALSDTVLSRVLRITPMHQKRFTYSDLNFILLRAALERMTGESLDAYLDRRIEAPLGNERIVYAPLDLFDKSEIAGTEDDTFLRQQLVQGYVHDEIAAFSGGVQGNAGLFANARSLDRWAQMLLGRGEYGGKRILKEETVDLFMNERSDSGRRGLGWEVVEGFVGHTGFTGTCMWISPSRGLVVTVLTNRVCPTRNNRAFKREDPRRVIFDAVRRGL